MTISAQIEDASVFETGNGPLYAAVKQFINARIESGAWPPTHRVPSENELVSELGVSRMTANRALRELASEGRIIRVKGVGSFVAKPRAISAIFDVKNIADEIRARGGIHGAKVVIHRKEYAGPEVAYSLGVEIGAAIAHSVIIHSENEFPIQLEDRFVVPEGAPDYLDQDFSALTPDAYLMDLVSTRRMEQCVEAVVAQPWEAKLLAFGPHEPCLLIGRRTWSEAGPLTSVRLVHPGSRYRLSSSSNS